MQAQDRGEPDHDMISAHGKRRVVIAGVKGAAHGVRQDTAEDDHAVHRPVGHGHGREPAAEHTAKDTQGEKQQEGHQGEHQPGKAGPPMGAAALGREQADKHIAHRHAAHAAQHMGAELAAPAGGEAVHTVGAPGAGQIGKQGHGQDNAENKMDPNGGGGGVCDDFQGHTPGLIRMGGLQVRRDIVPHPQGQNQKPQEGIAGKEGPAAAQVAAQQGRVKEGFCEQHRPHLLIHR